MNRFLLIPDVHVLLLRESKSLPRRRYHPGYPVVFAASEPHRVSPGSGADRRNAGALDSQRPVGDQPL